MFKKIVFNEINQNKFNSLTIMLFISLTTLLFALAIMLGVTLVSNVDKLMEKAKTPHYMQMHSGAINSAKLAQFASGEQIIKEYQLLEFVNFEDWNFTVNGKLFDGGVQDNGIVKQAAYFDYLLAENGEVIKPKPSEIYVPEMYLKNDIIQVGDRLQIMSKQFIVKGFLFDSQMSSPLASSKRFLISDKDFDELKEYGKTEYLVEFRLNNLADITLMENAYAKSGLGANGPALTYNMFKFINYISDFTIILILVVSSFFTLLIAFLSVKLTVLVNIEEGIKDIGILKAIGIENAVIKKLYRTKFILLSAIGSILGGLLALLFSPVLLSNIRVIIDENSILKLNILAIIISVTSIFVFVLIFLEFMLYKINKITFMETLYYSESAQKGSSKKSLLAKRTALTANRFMAFRGYGSLKSYSTLIKVIILCIMLINFPIIIYSTLSSEDIISSMGIGKSDIIVSIKQSPNMLASSQEIEKTLKSDNRIADYSILKTRAYEVVLDNGDKNRLLIETGDLEKFPITCNLGGLPKNNKEIALSSIVAEQYGKVVGDSLAVNINGKIETLLISGIYSDITNGGKTAKAIFENNDERIMWINIPVSLENNIDTASAIKDYQNKFKEANIADIKYYISKTFGLILNGIKKLVIGAYLFGMLVTLFICILYFTLLITKERYQVGIQRVLGFSFSDIVKQYRLRMLMIMSFSLVVGILISGVFSVLLIKIIFSSFGISGFVFKADPVMTGLVVPTSIILVAFLALVTTNHKIYSNEIIDSIKEI